jgi:hypothetical protein
MTVWTDFVKAFAAKNNLSYGCALSTPECRAEYALAYPKPPPKEKKVTKKALRAELAASLSKPSFIYAEPELEEAEVPINVKSLVTYPKLKSVARPAVEKVSAVKAAVAKIEKNIAYYEDKLKEALDYKMRNKKQLELPENADKKAKIELNIRRSTEAIDKLREREKPRPPTKEEVAEAFPPLEGSDLELDTVLDTLTDKNQVSLLYYILLEMKTFDIKGTTHLVDLVKNEYFTVKIPNVGKVNVLGAQERDIYNPMEDAVKALFDTPELDIRIYFAGANIGKKKGLRAAFYWNGKKGARGQQEFYNNAYQNRIAPIMDSQSWATRYNELEVIRQSKKAEKASGEDAASNAAYAAAGVDIDKVTLPELKRVYKQIITDKNNTVLSGSQAMFNLTVPRILNRLFVTLTKPSFLENKPQMFREFTDALRIRAAVTEKTKFLPSQILGNIASFLPQNALPASVKQLSVKKVKK